MNNVYSVALVVDPMFRENLRTLCAKVHTWVVASPDNRRVAKDIFDALPNPDDYSIERGITTFTERGTPEQCCISIIEDLDRHHNTYTHEPGYTILEVYGATASAEVRAKFEQFGLVEFSPTEVGFVARKREP